MNSNYMSNNENNSNGHVNYGFHFSNCEMKDCHFHDSYSKNQVPELKKDWSFLCVVIIFIFFVCNYFKLIN